MEEPNGPEERYLKWEIADKLKQEKADNVKLTSLLYDFIQNFEPNGSNMILDITYARAKLYFADREKINGPK